NVSDGELAENIEGVLKQNGFYRRLQTCVEYSRALGRVVGKPYAGTGRNGAPELKLGLVTADGFLPILRSTGQTTEGVLIKQTEKGTQWSTHLEWHQWEGTEYVIRNEL